MQDQLLLRRQHVLGERSLLFYDEPFAPVRASGVWMEDHSGRKFLDAYNNVPHVGHCHPHVVDAICRQAGQLNVHTRYLHEGIVTYGERLTATFEEELSTALFVCTGTEANELAIRMARLLTGGKGLIVSDFSYHGHSITLAEATTGLPAPEAIGPLVRTIRIPDLVHAGENADADAVGAEYLRLVQEAISSFQQAGIQVAALLLDTLFSTEGLLKVPNNYVKQAAQLVRDAGGLFIADEVQPGFGRMGEHMWGYQSHDVIPDFVTMGKPMGNGHPIGAVVTRREYLARFQEQTLYFNTFGGNPVSAAAGNAVLDVIENERLIDNARDVGEYVRRGLETLAQKHEIIGAVRGQGLFFGLELVTDRGSMQPATVDANRIVNLMRQRSVLISKIGPHASVLKIRPPMPFGTHEADILLDTLDGVIGDVSRG